LEQQNRINSKNMNEAKTCAKLIDLNLKALGWEVVEGS
jgi:type I site-specific restriction endonuclease